MEKTLEDGEQRCVLGAAGDGVGKAGQHFGEELEIEGQAAGNEGREQRGQAKDESTPVPPEKSKTQERGLLKLETDIEADEEPAPGGGSAITQDPRQRGRNGEDVEVSIPDVGNQARREQECVEDEETGGPGAQSE